GALRIAEHVGPQFGVGRLNGHEQRAQSFGEDAFGVEFGETGECREVPVEERQPIVVVLEVEAPAHALGQLVDEAEGAVVVTGPNPVEDGRGDLHTEGLPRVLADPHDPGKRRTGAPNEDAEVTRVAESLEIDDVARLLPVNAEELVAHGQTGAGYRRRRGDRSRRGS